MFEWLKKLFLRDNPETQEADDEELIPIIIPALVALLVRAEDLKESPLTLEEVLKLRDQAPSVVLPVSAKISMEESRGYKDIDPENAWHDWQNYRREAGRKPDIDPGPSFSHINTSAPAYLQTVDDAKASLETFRSMLSEKFHFSAMVKTMIFEADNHARMWLNNTE